MECGLDLFVLLKAVLRGGISWRMLVSFQGNFLPSLPRAWGGGAGRAAPGGAARAVHAAAGWLSRLLRVHFWSTRHPALPLLTESPLGLVWPCPSSTVFIGLTALCCPHTMRVPRTQDRILISSAIFFQCRLTFKSVSTCIT